MIAPRHELSHARGERSSRAQVVRFPGRRPRLAVVSGQRSTLQSQPNEQRRHGDEPSRRRERETIHRLGDEFHERSCCPMFPRWRSDSPTTWKAVSSPCAHPKSTSTSHGRRSMGKAVGRSNTIDLLITAGTAVLIHRCLMAIERTHVDVVADGKCRSPLLSPATRGGEKSSPISRLRAMRIRAISITCSRGDEQSAARWSCRQVPNGAKPRPSLRVLTNRLA